MDPSTEKHRRSCTKKQHPIENTKETTKSKPRKGKRIPITIEEVRRVNEERPYIKGQGISVEAFLSGTGLYVDP